MENKITPRLLKGFRDFSAREVYQRDFLKEKVREVFELYGFEPLETPAIEYLETFTGNVGEDEKLFFKFTDQGKREVALRYDQTVPTCRYVAGNLQNLVFPFKRYQIQTVWRAEKPQKGRYREFLQCDADIFGVKGPEADAEIISLVIAIYRHLGFVHFQVKINDRALFAGMPYSVIAAIDKMDKIGREGVLAEIVSKGFTSAEAESFLRQITEAKPSETLEKIFDYLKNLGVEDKYYAFEPKIARSFSYSTGPIWEVVIEGFSGGSVLGGERFDNLIGRFSNQSIPGTGFGLGFDRTLEAMQELGLLPEIATKTQVLATVFNSETLSATLKMVNLLRNNGVKTEIFSQPSDKMEKQLKYADKKGIPFVLIIGEDEIKNNLVILKNMKTREQVSLASSDLLKFFSKN